MNFIEALFRRILKNIIPTSYRMNLYVLNVCIKSKRHLLTSPRVL